MTAHGEIGSIDRCAICGSRTLGIEYSSRDLQVKVCAACDHREASHGAPEVEADYHLHTPQSSAFLTSLETTRRRQAGVILARFKALCPRPDGWLELGSGRGWFLEEAKAAGVAPLAGFDPSALATRWLRERGFEGAESLAESPQWPNWSSLSFAPSVASALDVVEHFPRHSATAALRRLGAELPSLRWLIVKVPISNGVMYRAARALRRIYPGPYRQMYQVGTSPPHHHYFSIRSFRLLLASAGFEVAEMWTDPDVDNLFHRIPRLARLPGGAFAARAIQVFPGDSAIAFARTVRGPSAAPS